LKVILWQECNLENLIWKEIFQNFFGGILQSAENNHPTLEKKLHGKVGKVYQSSVPSQEHDLIGYYQESPVVEGKHLSITKGNFQKMMRNLKGQSCDDKEQQLIMQQIVAKVETCLKDCKQYVEHLILEVIKYTKKLTKEKPKSLQKSMHLYAKKELTQKLAIIQHEWDK
jgi:hypothetical protein